MARVTPFGISALSKFNKDIAYLNEIMCNKETGEMLVRTPDGDTISYNYFNRLKTSIDTLTLASIHYNILGDLFKIAPFDIELPSPVESTIDSSIRINNPSIKGMILTVSVDGILISENNISLMTISDIYVDYTITITYMDGTTEDMNKHIQAQNMISDYIRFKDNVSSIDVSDMTFSASVNEGEQYILIVNNMLVLVNDK